MRPSLRLCHRRKTEVLGSVNEVHIASPISPRILSFKCKSYGFLVLIVFIRHVSHVRSLG